MRSWRPCKLADATDFFLPEFSEHLARLGEAPTFHNKQWEWAQILETRRRLAPDARRLIGLGAGHEPTIPLLAEGATEVIATDLYEREGGWQTASKRPDRVYPHLKQLRSHHMDMLRVDLPPKSADFVWSMCAVEHVGGLDEVIEAVRQAGTLVAPGGVLFISTEFSLSGPYRSGSTLYFDRSMIEKVVRRSGLHLVEPIELRLARHPMNVPLWSGARAFSDALPHVVYRAQPVPVFGAYATVLSFVLSTEDRGVPIFEADPELDRVVEELGEQGRKLNRRVAPPWHWW